MYNTESTKCQYFFRYVQYPKNLKLNICFFFLLSFYHSGLIYTVLVLFLGSTCTREALQTNSLIMEEVNFSFKFYFFILFQELKQF